MAGCADRGSTWINDGSSRLLEMHEAGFAHSIECWKDGELVGGLYGVHIKVAFFGESMFARATDASKIALVHLVARLRVGGFRLLDTQMATDHMMRFGAVDIPRSEYRRQLAAALEAMPSFIGRRVRKCATPCSRSPRRRRPDVRAPRPQGSRRTSTLEYLVDRLGGLALGDFDECRALRRLPGGRLRQAQTTTSSEPNSTVWPTGASRPRTPAGHLVESSGGSRCPSPAPGQGRPRGRREVQGREGRA